MLKMGCLGRKPRRNLIKTFYQKNNDGAHSGTILYLLYDVSAELIQIRAYYHRLH